MKFLSSQRWSLQLPPQQLYFNPLKKTRYKIIDELWTRHFLVCSHGYVSSLHWRHNGRDGVSYHQPHDCVLNRLFRRRSTKTSNVCVTGLCAGNSPLAGEFSAQMASDAENASIWWRHHVVAYQGNAKQFPVMGISRFSSARHLK